MTKLEQLAKAMWDEQERRLGTCTPWSACESGAFGRQLMLAYAEISLRTIRVDMNLMLQVGREIGVQPSTVGLCWTRCIDAILAEKAE